MSITSIGKFLTSSGTPQAGRPESGVLHSCSIGIIECISRTVFSGDNCAHLRSQLSQLQDALTPDLKPQEASRVLGLLSGLLEEYRSTSRQAALAQTVEVQHIFAMLNQALIVLSDGRDSSVARLNKIQASLQQTSMIQDIVALKSSLADTVKFVQAESAQARAAVSEELSQFETEVVKAREFLGSTRGELAGRPEGVRRISEGLMNLLPGQALYAVVYLFDRLTAVKQRYGLEVAEELIFRIIKERLQPVATANTTYRWNSLSIVGLFERTRDLGALRLQVANLNRIPVVHRIALGNRKAVLTVTPSHLVAEGHSDPSLLVTQLDEFTGIYD